MRSSAAHWADETWHEVLCLIAGMIDARFVEQLALPFSSPAPLRTTTSTTTSFWRPSVSTRFATRPSWLPFANL